jgi:hypothetical protein
MTLDDIEGRLRHLRDPRMHFASNCGSGGCPRLDATAFAGEEIDKTLDRKTRAFVNDPKNVQVDEAKSEVMLSKIFEWYEEDFVESLPPGSTILDYVLRYSEPPLSARLAKAKSFTVRYSEYDWSVNKKK